MTNQPDTADKQLEPYKVECRGSYWIVIDSRTGGHVSYPAPKRQAVNEAAILNRAYAEAVSA